MTREQVRYFSRISLCQRSLERNTQRFRIFERFSKTSVQGFRALETGRMDKRRKAFIAAVICREAEFTLNRPFATLCVPQGTQFTYLEGQLHDAASITILDASDR